MGTKRVLVKVCDACGLEKDPVFRVRITIEGNRGMFGDLCASCKAPIDRVLRKVREGHPTRLGVADLPMLTERQLGAVTKAGKKGSQSPRKAPRSDEGGEVG